MIFIINLGGAGLRARLIFIILHSLEWMNNLCSTKGGHGVPPHPTVDSWLQHAKKLPSNAISAINGGWPCLISNMVCSTNPGLKLFNILILENFAS